MTSEVNSAVTYEVNSSVRPAALRGFSTEQIAQHWQLYEGYVKQVNALDAELQFLRKQAMTGTPLYADRRRRFGFECNGLVLHEYYFANLAAGVAPPTAASDLKKAIVGQFGTFEAFKEDFVAAAATRSVGWAILHLDPVTGVLNNHFVQLHEDGNVAGFAPLLVMDVWEHAYMADYGAGGCGAYIEAFWDNVNWHVVERRFQKAMDGRLLPRHATAAHAD